MIPLCLNAICACCLISLTYLFWRKRVTSPSSGGSSNLKVPKVPGSLWFVGHGLQFGYDMPKFITSCYTKYGKIFEVKLFSSRIVIICDKTLAEEYYKFGETTLSFQKYLENLYFAQAFFQGKEDLPRFGTVIRKTLGSKVNPFLPEMVKHATHFLTRIKSRLKQSLDLDEEIRHFVLSTNSGSLTNIQLSQQGYEKYLKFSQLLNSAVAWSYIFPVWCLKFFYQRRLLALRSSLTTEIEPTIQKYRMGLEPLESSAFLKSILGSPWGEKMKNQEIASYYAALLYSSENTVTTLSTCLVDILSDIPTWLEFQSKARSYVETKDYIGLVKDNFLVACVLESTRFSTTTISIGRTLLKRIAIGGYDLDPSVDAVYLCGKALQLHGSSAKETYSYPEVFNPYRFLGDKPEPSSPPCYTAFGGGIHYCPGRAFAIWEILIGLSFLVSEFDITLDPSTEVKLDYHGTKAVVEKKAKFIVTCREA